MLQYVIPHVPKTAVPINEKLAMDKENGKICFSTITGPVYICQANDKSALRFAQGMLVSLKMASAIEISKALGVNRSTVSRNVNVFESHGMAGFVNNYTGNGPLKLIRSKQLIVKRLLDNGSTVAAAARKVGVTEGCIRAALKKGYIEKGVSSAETSVESAAIKGPSVRSQEDTGSNSGVAVKREMEQDTDIPGLFLSMVCQTLPWQKAGIDTITCRGKAGMKHGLKTALLRLPARFAKNL